MSEFSKSFKNEHAYVIEYRMRSVEKCRGVVDRKIFFESLSDGLIDNDYYEKATRDVSVESTL